MLSLRAVHQDSSRSALLEAAFQQAPVALSLLKLDGTQLDANLAYKALMRLGDTDLQRSSGLDVTHPDDRPRTAAYLAQLAAGEIEHLVTEKTYLRADGTAFQGRLTAKPLRDEHGTIVAMLGAVHDLTEQDVFDRVQRQVASSRSESEVAARSAHELNNLLATMLLTVDLADESPSVSSLRPLIERAASLGEALLHLTDDRLAVSSFAGDGDGERLSDAVGSPVLVVDDEPALRQAVAQALERSGYHVLIATNGSDALRVAADQGTLSLVVVDLLMPGMDGAELARRLRVDRPDLPVLFITGYAGGDLAERLPHDAAVLRKPFRALDLVTSVARLLPPES